MIKILFFDIESDGLLYEATKIHCIVIHRQTPPNWLYYYDKSSGVQSKGWNGEAIDGIHYLNNHAGKVVGHNIAGFDLPLIKKLYPHLCGNWPHLLSNNENSNLEAGYPVPIDTYALSCMLFPQQQEHGLAAWGKKLGQEKQEHEDWSVFSEETLTRCSSDVEINMKLYKYLAAKAIEYRSATDGITFTHAINREQKVQQIHSEQEQTGVRLDVLKAAHLVRDLDAKTKVLSDYIIARAPKRIVNTHKAVGDDEVYQNYQLINPLESGESSVIREPYKKNGEFRQTVLKHYDASQRQAEAANIKGAFSRIKIETLNLDSDKQVKEFLLTLGWKPLEWNFSKKTRERTSPKLTEDSYRSLPAGLGKKIAEYNIVTHRRGLILNRKGDQKGALWNIRDDGRVPAEAYTCGTPTARYRHKKSICNIPRPSSPYGEEIRGMYCVPEDYQMLGLDLKGIEIRMMVHFAYPYPGGKEFYELVMDGDFHANNGRLWSVSREDSKPGLYGLCYGAQAKKLANILGKPEGDGKRLFDSFWGTYPALRHLVDDLERSYKMNKCIIGLDRRRVDVREPRKLLNTLIQSASAIIFKAWMIKNYTVIHNSHWQDWVKQIIAYHDELQYEIRSSVRKDAEVVAGVFQKNAVAIGKQFKINPPIEADAQIGMSWADTH